MCTKKQSTRNVARAEKSLFAHKESEESWRKPRNSSHYFGFRSDSVAYRSSKSKLLAVEPLEDMMLFPNEPSCDRCRKQHIVLGNLSACSFDLLHEPVPGCDVFKNACQTFFVHGFFSLSHRKHSGSIESIALHVLCRERIGSCEYYVHMQCEQAGCLFIHRKSLRFRQYPVFLQTIFSIPIGHQFRLLIRFLLHAFLTLPIHPQFFQRPQLQDFYLLRQG